MATVGYLIPFRVYPNAATESMFSTWRRQHTRHKRNQPTDILSSSLVRTQPLSRIKLSLERVKKGSDHHSIVTTIPLCKLNTAGNVVMILLYSLYTLEPNLKTPAGLARSRYSANCNITLYMPLASKL
jgi:hypothetical protein